MYHKLVAKINSIDTSEFVLTLSIIENKIPETSDLIKKTDYNTKITEIESKIPDVSGLVTKTDYNTKITEIENELNNHDHDKYIASSELNTLAADVFSAKLARENLVAKTNFDNNVSSLNSKIAASITKKESIENDFEKLKKFDLTTK